MYLYTDVIEFAPFGSEQNRRSRSAEIVDPSEDKLPRSSPKSIYRLADKVCTCSPYYSICPVFDESLPQYDVPALKALALNRIRGELGRCNIVEESFSRFVSQ